MVVATTGVIALHRLGKLIRRSTTAEVGNRLVELPTPGVGPLRLVDQHHIAGINPPDRIHVGDIDGIRACASTVDNSNPNTVVVIQIATGRHDTIASITEHAAKRGARAKKCGIFTPVHRSIVTAVDLCF
jgi:hypothetical protein